MKIAVTFTLVIVSLSALAEEFPGWVSMGDGDVVMSEDAMKAMKEWAEEFYSIESGIVEYVYRVGDSQREIEVMVYPVYSDGLVTEHNEMCLSIEQAGRVSSVKNFYAP